MYQIYNFLFAQIKRTEVRLFQSAHHPLIHFLHLCRAAVRGDDEVNKK